MNDLFNAIDPIHIARVAGSGNKIIHLIDKKADYYLNLVPGFKYWDMCAADALIRGMHGIVTDANKGRIIYDH
jgi:3'-phosphoadenosine 5'-phosphosulfate (PAPS) 3'-phosphatase